MYARTAEDVGALVRGQRLALRMSQAALATAIGASRQWVVDLERGKSTLALGLVLRAVAAVGLTLRLDTSAAVLDPGVPLVDLDVVLARAHAPMTTKSGRAMPMKMAGATMSRRMPAKKGGSKARAKRARR